MIKRFLSMLVLLMTVATGALAQSTTHVVKQDNVNTIFGGDGYTLGDAVKAGDVLDFQGTINLEGDASHSLVINKPVNIISSTKNAVVKLNTPTNVTSGAYTATVMYPQSFVINKDGSGTTVQDIRIENTETWLYNTSNVTFTGVTMWVEEARVGAGVGHVSIRYSDHVTFDGCTVYTKNNGGSAGCLLAGSHDCTFKDTRFEGVGSTGNALYLGNSLNANDKPADYTMNGDNISVLNCTLTKDVATPMCIFAIGGLRHHIEGCTIVNMNTSSAFGATVPNSASEGHTILNNTIKDGNLNVLKYCTAEGNTVTGTSSMIISEGATVNNNTITVTGTGKVTVNKGSTVTGNTINGNVTVAANGTDYIGSTITGNTINGTVTFAANSKNNTLTRNVITSTGDYAVVMASTADANNTVQYNTLKSAKYNGDEAVNPSTGTGNTISYNSTYAITLAEGTEDADKWTVKVGEGEAQAFPVEGLEGATVTVTYSGTKKVKSVKAVKKAAVPVTSITLNKTETSIMVGATETLSVTSVLPEEATDKTYTWKTSDETKATVDQDGKVTAVAAGTVTIYAEANDGSGVKGNCTVTVTPAAITVTWNDSDITGGGMSFTKDGVTITANLMDLNSKNFEDGGTITTTLGNFTKIEVTAMEVEVSGTGWSGSTWTGNASSVSFSGSIRGLHMGNVKFVFTIEPTN